MGDISSAYSGAGGGYLDESAQRAGEAFKRLLVYLVMRMAQGLADGIVIGTLSAFAVIACFRVALVDMDVWKAVVSVACIGLLLLIQSWLSIASTGKAVGAVVYLALVAEVVLVAAPMAAFGETWLSLPGFVAGSLLLTLPAPAAVPSFGAVVVLMGVAENAYRGEASAIAFSVVSTATTGLIVYGISRLAHLVRCVRDTRDQIARMAVDEERMRFERDVHDLLGEQLSTITLKSELVNRLMRESPSRARDELAEILAIARTTLSSVRAVAHAFREPSLPKACESARLLLAAADVPLDVDLACPDPPSRNVALIVAVLREGVMNVLRHSEVGRCSLSIREETGQVVLDLVNDGVLEPASATEGGLAELTGWVEAAGGELRASENGDGEYRLRMSLPLASELPAAEKDDVGPTESVMVNMAPRLANSILVAVLCGFGLLAAVNILVTDGTVGEIVLSLFFLAAMLSLQIGYFGRPSANFQHAFTGPALLMQVMLAYVPLALIGNPWVPVIGIPAGSVLLALRPRVSVPLFVLIALSGGLAEVLTAAPWAVRAGFAVAVPYSVVATAITGLVVFGLTRLARLAREIESMHGERARMELASERLRFARDLHDLLGLSLSAITLRGEITYRLMGEHPDQARSQLGEILVMVRKASQDARFAVTGTRELSLVDECSCAESVFAATDIEVTIVRDDHDWRGLIGTVLATVLREGVTNVLRHSKAEWCQITVAERDGWACLEVVNDGVSELGDDTADKDVTPPADCQDWDTAGNGLRNLAHRVHALGGELRAGPEGDEVFRLRVALPPGAASPRHRQNDGLTALHS